MRTGELHDPHAGLAATAAKAASLGPNPVPAAAALWGAVVFFPVGVNYLAFVLLGLAFLARGWRDRDGDTSLGARARRIRAHPLFWPLALFAAWTLLAVLLGPHYPETPSNAFHGARIVATLACALALTRRELDRAIGGFLFGLAVSAAIVGLHHAVGMPDPQLWGGLTVWSNLLQVIGNKSISNAVLFAFAGSAALACAVDARGARRAAYLLAYALALATVVWALPSRTGVVILVAAVPVLAIHRFRGSWRRMLAVSIGSLALLASLVAAIPAARDRLDQGWAELQGALAGEVARTSWGLRLNMYRHSADMVVERPLLGWGVGGWNDQWRRRAPESIADMNMPHNDFLWMGAQTGVVGMLAVAALVFATVGRIAARRDRIGRLGAVATLCWLVAISANSAMRDGVIGLSMLWIVGLVLRMQTEPRSNGPAEPRPLAGALSPCGQAGGGNAPGTGTGAGTGAGAGAGANTQAGRTPRALLYWRLVRLHRPIGILLLLWPTMWALWIASGGFPEAYPLVAFVAGTVLMRSAGCAINDWADRDFDRHVARTRDRPLTAGLIRPWEAVAVFVALSLVALALIVPFNPLTWALAVVAAFLAVSYPFTKRFLALPQAYLGIAFGFGIPMAFAAVLGTLPLAAWLMLVANVFWAIAYDTEYAMVDRDDDLRIGIRTAAITFGRFDVAAVMTCYALALALLAVVGAVEGMGAAYYVGLLAAGGVAVYHYRLIRGRGREGCFRAFNHNNWLGAVVFAGVALDFALR